MRLRHIEVFNAVMLTGSVSAAARLINVTQPAVSRTLQHAEMQLGLTLFHRVRNRLVPTPEAQALYPQVEQLFAGLDQVRRLASTLRAGSEAGTIRVASILAFGHEVLPRALTRFRERFPKVHVHFRSLHSPQIVSSLVLQEADIGFLFDPVSHPALAKETLTEGELVCIAARGLLPQSCVQSRSISLTDLSALPVISLEASDPLGNMLAQAADEGGFARSSRVAVQTYHAAMALALHGHGVAIVDSCTALSAPRERLDVVPLRPRVPVPVQMLRSAARPGSVAQKAFARAVQQVLLQDAGHLMPAREAPAPAARSRKQA